MKTKHGFKNCLESSSCPPEGKTGSAHWHRHLTNGFACCTTIFGEAHQVELFLLWVANHTLPTGLKQKFGVY